MNQKIKTLVLWGVLICLFLLVVGYLQRQEQMKNVGYSEFHADLVKKKISEVTISGNKYVYKRLMAAGEEEVWTVGVEPDQELLQLLLDNQAKVTIEQSDDDGLL